MTDTSQPAEWVVSETAEVHAVLADERFGVRPAEAGRPVRNRGLAARVGLPVRQRARARPAPGPGGGRAGPPRPGRAARRRPATARWPGWPGWAGPSGLTTVRPTPRPSAAWPARCLPRCWPPSSARPIPDQVADAVGAVAAAYFPGAGEAAERAADAATASLLDLLAGPGPDEVVARITVLVQGYDATANLVAAALSLLPALSADVPADRLLAAGRLPAASGARRCAASPWQRPGLAAGPSPRTTRWCAPSSRGRARRTRSRRADVRLRPAAVPGSGPGAGAGGRGHRRHTGAGTAERHRASRVAAGRGAGSGSAGDGLLDQRPAEVPHQAAAPVRVLHHVGERVHGTGRPRSR